MCMLIDNMKFPALAVILLLVVSQSSISKCQSGSYSALSCALGRSLFYPAIQVDKNSLYKSENIGDNVIFFLYTKEKSDGETIKVGDSDGIQKSSFGPHRPTKILIHGYMADAGSCTGVKDAFLQNEDCNVIVIDWWKMQSLWGSIPKDYFTVTKMVPEVGQYIAEMIDFLENHGMNIETTTLVGHSLGSHAIGIAGNKTSNRVRYIVGLDPASPSYDDKKPGERLSSRDADFVEVIHTNQGDCGMGEPIGHFDFYPNGGARQPGCKSNTCSHSRSWELYAESINTLQGFYGRRCENLESAKNGTCSGKVALMGDQTKSKVTQAGIYYLQTNEASPYARGMR